MPCPANTFSKPGAGSAQDCTPTPGYYSGAGTNAATVCPAGNYCPGDGSVTRCPFGTTSAKLNADKAGCSIVSGFYGRFSLLQLRTLLVIPCRPFHLP
jgi:hypothetical protein